MDNFIRTNNSYDGNVNGVMNNNDSKNKTKGKSKVKWYYKILLVFFVVVEIILKFDSFYVRHVGEASPIPFAIFFTLSVILLSHVIGKIFGEKYGLCAGFSYILFDMVWNFLYNLHYAGVI